MDRTFSDEARNALRTRELENLGPRYSPLVHWLGPTVVGSLVVVAALLTLDDVQGWEWAVIPATYVLSNAAEWRIHRDLLHRPTPGLKWLYERHTLMHHRVFLERDLEVRSRKEWGLVLIPPLAVVLLCLATIPLAAAMTALGQPDAGRLFLVTAIAYVLSYEWLHLSYHLPADGPVGRLGIIRWLRRHHATHHDPARMGTTNFNVTVPLWDRVRGTTGSSPMGESPATRRTARGPAAPGGRRTDPLSR